MPPGFTFPPPPPPPPPASFDSNAIGQQSGRSGRWQNRGRGRARGPHFYQGHGSRQTADWDRPEQYHGSFLRREHPAPSNWAAQQNSQKRNYGQAFLSRPQHPQLTTAPPAVPSFGQPLPMVSASNNNSTAGLNPKPKKERTFNRLGLTPRKEEHESSEEEDDADEELRLGAASRQFGHDALQFEHKGKLMTLRTPAEIQAWVAERKKRYPTKAKITAAFAAKIKLKEQSHSRNATENVAKRGKQKSVSTRKPGKAERSTGGKAFKDAGSNLKNTGTLSVQRFGHRTPKCSHAIDVQSESDSLRLTPEDTSSSGASDTSEDSDDAPMEQSAKVPVAALSSTPASTQPRRQSDLACPRLRKTGHCRLSGCSYQHDNPYHTLKTMPNSASKGRGGMSRVSLYDRLLAQQHDQEDQEILQFIFSIGERGLLDSGA